MFFSLLGVVLSGMMLHEFLRERDAELARRTGATALTQLLQAQFRADIPRSDEDLQRACDRLVGHPAIFAVRVWDQTGAPVAEAAIADEWMTLVDASMRSGANGPSVAQVQPPSGPSRGAYEVRQIVTDLGVHPRAERPRRLAFLLGTTASTQSRSAHLLFFALPLVAAGCVAFLVGSQRLGRRVVRPIEFLAGMLAKCGCQDDAAVPAEGENELTRLGRCLTELQDDVKSWRLRAEQVERRMDSQIAARTQRITCDLRRMQREAWLDPLTGVNNRRLLDEKFPEIFAAQRSARQDLAVVMIDLDHFKILNDTLGHAAGDEVLTFAGELLRQCVRSDDLVVRYGGDEFTLILPGLSAESALTMTSRIMSLFHQRARMMATVQPAPSMSAGIASLMNNWPASHLEMLGLADRALYDAKRFGKAQAQICRSATSFSGRSS